MVIFEAVDLIFRVHGEGHSIKALVTDDTAEAAWVVGLPQGLEDLQQQKREANHQINHRVHFTIGLSDGIFLPNLRHR